MSTSPTITASLTPSSTVSATPTVSTTPSFGTSLTRTVTVTPSPLPIFAPAVSYAVGNYPVGITASDFNNDGNPDLAISNYYSNNVSVLLGNGNGTFQVATTYNVGSYPWGVATNDFNGDSKSDLAVANEGSGNISILLGNGDGTFQIAVNYNAASVPCDVVINDFNGDGKADLVAANYGSNNISVLLGVGNGTFLTAVNYNVGTYPVGISTNDFNGDGKLDLAVTNLGTNNISILLGNGNGTFLTATNYNVGNVPQGITSGDFNGNGKQDLAVANHGSDSVSILLGNSDGSFGAATNYSAGSNPYWVATNDFNGDGKQDLVVANEVSPGIISVLLGSGDGSFGIATSYDADSNPQWIIADDFNNDGRLDLAVTNRGSDNVSILLNIYPMVVSSSLSRTTTATLSSSSTISASYSSSLTKTVTVTESPSLSPTQTITFTPTVTTTTSSSLTYTSTVTTTASKSWSVTKSSSMTITPTSTPSPQPWSLLAYEDSTNQTGRYIVSGTYPNAIIADDFTGLTWEQTVSSSTYFWNASAPVGSAQAYCASLTKESFADWRLPEIKELQSLVDYTLTTAPVINSAAFPTTTIINIWWWSAANYLETPNNAWTVNFYDGGIGARDSDNPSNIRCVRGGNAVPTIQFTDEYGNILSQNITIIKDQTTGLVWQRARASEFLEWDASISIGSAQWYCQNLVIGNYGAGSWRLPIVKELTTLASYDIYNPSINGIAFPDTHWTPMPDFRTSTSYSRGNGAAWDVEFANGNTRALSNFNNYCVRCILNHAATPNNSMWSSIAYEDTTNQPTRYYISGTSPNAVITDDFTGLMWEQTVSSSTYFWNASAPAGSAQAYCASITKGGYNDWRLPTPLELLSLIDSTTVTTPFINRIAFPGTTGSHFWTTAKFIVNPTYSWFVEFDNGGQIYIDTTSVTNNVRCVRGISLPIGTNYISINNIQLTLQNNAVYDQITGLTWQRTQASSTLVWDVFSTEGSAQWYCNNLVIGNYGAGLWQLPTMKQLTSLINYGRSDPAVNSTAFPSITSSTGFFWSSSALSQSTGSTWQIDINHGSLGGDNDNVLHNVRCVLSNGASPNKGLWSPIAWEDSTAQIARYYVSGTSPNAVVADDFTGLMWEQTVSSSTYFWNASAPSGSAQAYCASLTKGGYTDWRLPIMQELQSLTDYTIAYPGSMMNPLAFVSIPTTYGYWSSDVYIPTNVISNSNAWYQYFDNGYTAYQNIDIPIYARCVRGIDHSVQSNYTSDLGYNLSGNDTVVLDHKTGFLWQRALSSAQLLWNSSSPIGTAQWYCKNLVIGNYGAGSWQLPTPKQILSIIDLSTFWPSINVVAFPDTKVAYYWTSTPRASSSTAAWHISSDIGSCTMDEISHPKYARCILGNSESSNNGLWSPIAWEDSTAQIARYYVSGTSPNAVVIDDFTGLMWEQTVSGSGFWNASAPTGSAQAYCAGLSKGGYTDWRIPLSIELISLADHTIISPGSIVNVAAFPSMPWTMWTSGFQQSFGSAVRIQFDNGIPYLTSTDSELSVMCIRGGYTSNLYNYTDENGHSLTTQSVMVKDQLTSLIWQRAHSFPGFGLTWDPAASSGSAQWYCNNLVIGQYGVGSWELPTFKQLFSLANNLFSYPAINTTAFPDTSSTLYWSSTQVADSPGAAIQVNFQRGNGWSSYNAQFPARCVLHSDAAPNNGKWSTIAFEDATNQVVIDTTNQPSRYHVFGDSPNATVADDFTGLMWEQTANGTSVSWSATAASGSAQRYCQTLTKGNYIDWRMPSIQELQSLIDYTVTVTSIVSINNAAFPNPQNAYYLVSDIYIQNPAFAWNIQFNNSGLLYANADVNSASYNVRCVRGGGYEVDFRFTDENGNHLTESSTIVKDLDTELLWQRIPTLQTWINAFYYCGNLTLGSISWVLPTIKALQTLVDYSIYNPSINNTAFPGSFTSDYRGAGDFWVSTPVAWYPGLDGRFIIFSSGGNSASSNVNTNRYVRCVSIPTPTPSPSSSVTPTPSTTSTSTVTTTITSTITSSVTVSATPSVTTTATYTSSATVFATPSITSTVSLTQSQTPTPGMTSSVTATFTITPTPTATVTSSATLSPTVSTTITSTTSVTATTSTTPTITPSSSPIPIFAPAVNYNVGDSPHGIGSNDLNGDGIIDLAVSNYFSSDISILLGQENGTFQTAIDFNVGGILNGLATNDFNSDGKQDLAITIYNLGIVSVLLGNGNGTFQAANSYNIGDGPHRVIANDFNGDMKLDLAVANEWSYTISILLGNGNGTFQTAVSYNVGVYPVEVIAYDFNSNSILDLAVTNWNSGYVSVLLGNSDGTFQAAVNYNVGSNPAGIASSDFNSDNKLDLAVTNQGSNYVSILLGNGNGTFQTPINYAVGNSPMGIVSSDFNGDGKQDLVTTNVGSNSISVLLGNGDGAFVSTATYNVASCPEWITLNDFNNDGKPDLAVTNYNSDNISILLNIYPMLVSSTRTVTTTAAYTPSHTVSASPTLTASSSVTATTTPTITSTTSSTHSSTKSTSPTKSYSVTPSATSSASASYISSPSNSYPQMRVMYADNSEFSSPFEISPLNHTNNFLAQKIDTANANYTSNITIRGIGDFNGDMVLDYIISTPLANNQTGQSNLIYGRLYQSFILLPLPILDHDNGIVIDGINQGDLSGYSVSSAGDVNNDGLPDIMIGAPGSNNGAGQVTILFGNHFGFSYPYSGFGFIVEGLFAGDRFGYSVSAIGDINNDGFAEILVGAPGASGKSGQAYIIYGQKESSNQPIDLLNHSQVSIIFNLNMGYSFGASVGSGDFNNDGFADLLIGAPGSNNKTGMCYMFYGNKDGLFDLPSDLTELTKTQGVVFYGANQGDLTGLTVSWIGDINSDGFDDIAIGAPGANDATGKLYVVFGKHSFTDIDLTTTAFDGLNGFTVEGVNTGDALGSSVMNAGDVNGDGLADMLINAPGASNGASAGAGQSYLIFGKHGGFANINLTMLESTDGYSIDGICGGIDPILQMTLLGI